VDSARQLRVEAEFLFLGVDFVIGFGLLKFGLPILADEANVDKKMASNETANGSLLLLHRSRRGSGERGLSQQVGQ
jgi:hypothetical protein